MSNDDIDRAEIEQMVAELTAEGWTEARLHVWRSPEGETFRGPAGAWKAMKRAANERRLDGLPCRPAWAVRVLP